MTIDPKRYGRPRSGRGKSPVMVNIRLRRKSRTPPTRDDVVACLAHLLQTRTVPHGWEVAFIDWRHPAKASHDWRRGALADFDAFAAVIQSAYDDARIAIVRRDDETHDSEL